MDDNEYYSMMRRQYSHTDNLFKKKKPAPKDQTPDKTGGDEPASKTEGKDSSVPQRSSRND